MDYLFSDDPRERESAASKFMVFPRKVALLPKWEKDWRSLLGTRDIDDGLPWPEELLKIINSQPWPEYALGTANAACLLVWQRPGKQGENGPYIAPCLPVLGGIPHAHNVYWWPKYHSSRSWMYLHRYLTQAFDRLRNPWSQVMTVCLNTEPAPAGQVDARVNRQSVNRGLLDFMVRICQPRLILLCGNPVHTAVSKWNPPVGTKVLKISHPSTWEGYGHGRVDGPVIAKQAKAILFQ